MKQLLVKHFAIAAFAFCAVPGTLLAQKEKEKEKTKEKTERQQIIITRTGDKDEKTVIEIEGNKVKVNGKDVADLKDVQVHVNNLRTPNAMTFRTMPDRNFNMTWNDEGGHLFSVDSNRAMLGVVTDGDDKGAEIQSVTKESAAEKAGLKKGDVITKIDNRKIDATDDVSEAVRAHKPGEKVSITYLRDGKEQKTTAELGRWKGIDMKGMTIAPKIFSEDTWNNNLNNRMMERTLPGGVFSMAGNRPRLGLSVQDTDDGKGVKVLDVDDEGMGAKAGIKEGDVITMVDDKAVNSADDIAKLMREKREQPTVKMQLNRNGKTQTVEVKMKKPKTVDL
ncbi:PDZ domain-containing protein [Flavisolibacter ginsenosidimutans]|uniref:PDZ domain-containing protein n=1 Tax=Flavisolibacter ginsenosidimutans TaxID=661481 RepID=A0A5B8UM97_9BACT|nr:PDZ domain-containing protein [Flavisolibacter ginsenosidimutans]QEC57784.1 PDZ domain-containing protein [Flavisolibacter ginsenosidimutans]